MARGHTFIKLSQQEFQKLEQFLKTVLSERGLRARRRGQAIWYSHQGKSVDWIAEHFRVHKATIWEWIRTYKKKVLKD